MVITTCPLKTGLILWLPPGRFSCMLCNIFGFSFQKEEGEERVGDRQMWSNISWKSLIGAFTVIISYAGDEKRLLTKVRFLGLKSYDIVMSVRLYF